MMWKTYLESVLIFMGVPCTRVRAFIRAINSAFCELVPEGRDFASMVVFK